MKNTKTENEIMTLREVAAYLKLPEKKVEKMVRKKEIPATLIAKEWRFMRSVVDDWLMSKMQVIPHNDLAMLIESGTDILPISRLTRGDFILMDIHPGIKAEVLRQLIRPLVESGIIADEEAFLEKLIQREKLLSTSIGKGVAIPHIREPRQNPSGLPDFLVGICREGTDFESPDGAKTHIFFLLCTDSEVVHIKIMAKIAAFLRTPQIIERLIGAGSKEEVIKILIEEDRKMLMI